MLVSLSPEPVPPYNGRTLDQPNKLSFVPALNGSALSSFFSRTMPSDAIWSAIARPDAIVSSETLTFSAKTLFTTEYSTPRITPLTESVIASKIAIGACARTSARFGCLSFPAAATTMSAAISTTTIKIINDAVLQILGHNCQGAAKHQIVQFFPYYLVINNSKTDPTTVSLPKDAEVYQLSAEALRAGTMLCNGKPLVLGEDNSLPEITPVAAPAGELTLLAATCTFIVL